MTDALGNHVQTAWTADNHPATTTDALGHTTTDGYDGNNNPTSVTLPTGASTSAVYGTVSRIPGFVVPVKTFDARGDETDNSYDANGNLLTVSEPATVNGKPTTITTHSIYNANGTVASAGTMRSSLPSRTRSQSWLSSTGGSVTSSASRPSARKVALLIALPGNGGRIAVTLHHRRCLFLSRG